MSRKVQIPEGLDGVGVVRFAVGGMRLVEVRGEGEELVLRFENGAVLAVSGGVGVDLPVVGAAVVGGFGEWGLQVGENPHREG